MGWLQAVAAPPESRGTKTPGVPLSNPSSWLVDLLGGPDSATGIRVTQDSALTSAAVYSAVKAISETIAAFPIELYRSLSSGGRQLAIDHPIRQLLHAPNPEMTSMEWRETCVGHLLLWGNSYTAIERDNAFRPIALWPLRPDRMQVWRDPETHHLTYTYALWQGGTAILDPIDVMHVRTLSRDGILGMSPVGQMREAIGLGLGLERYGGALYGNGASPGGVLQHPGQLSKDAKENMRRSWEEMHRGPAQVGRVAVLEEGVTWKAVGMAPQDAEFLLSRTFSLQEIARIYRMPPHKLQDLSQNATSSLEQLNSEWVSDCLLPYIVRWEQRSQRSLLQGLDLRRMFIRHTVDHLLRGDMRARYAAYAMGRQWGWLSANDVRAKEDMNPLPDGQGDDYMVPANMLPADQVGETELPAPQQVPAHPPGPDAGGLGGHSPSKQMAQDAAQRLLIAFLEDAARRIVAREDADICRAARAARFRRDRRAWERWLEDFAEGHRVFVIRQVLPALREVAPEELVETLAAELAEREVRALLQVVRGLADLAELEVRLARWREERPLQLVAEETPRLALLPPLPTRAVPPLPLPAPPVVHVHNQQAPAPDVHLEAHLEPPVTRIEPGAFQATVLPAQVQAGDTHVTVLPPPPAEVQVNVATPPVRVQQGDTHVEVHPPPPAEVNVDVTAPPVEVRQGDTHVTVQPAEVRAGDVHVDVQAPPPAPAPSVTVHNQPAPAPDVQVDVNVAPAEVRVENRLPEPPRPPRPRLERARERLEMLEKGLKSAENGSKVVQNRQKPRQNRPRRGRRR